jgi:hypothetical protein
MGSPVPLGNPAAGQAAVYTPGERGREIIVAATFKLVTSNHVSDRFPSCTVIDRQGRVVDVGATPYARQASGTVVCSFGVGKAQFGATNAAFVGGPLTELALSGGESLTLDALNMDAADQISEAVLWVVEIEDDDDAG